MHQVRHPRFFTLLLASLSMLVQFSIVTYLPAFADMARDLHVGPVEMQQTITAYLLPFGIMVAWHGAISDAIGRRSMILVGLALYALGSLLCALTSSIEWMYVGRAVQGFSAAIGATLARAMVRDCYQGVAAQQQSALIAMVFALAPALAPIVGGGLLYWAGWRSIFVFLALAVGTLLLVSWWWLPETLPPEKRHSLHPLAMVKAYGEVLGHRQFLLLCLANAGGYMALYVYIFAAPVFVTQHLGLSAQSFAWLFVPLVGGMLAGSVLGHRMAGRYSAWHTVLLGQVIMFTAAGLNIALAALVAPGLPWSLIALPVFAAGFMLTQPSLQLLALDCLPQRRGLASSGYITVQHLCNTASVALLLPLIMGSTLSLALSMLALQLLGGGALWIWQRMRD